MNEIKTYGDRLGDGMIQLSFTLPLAPSPEAKEAAVQYCKKLGLDKILVTHMEGIYGGFSFFVVYARSNATVDTDTIQVIKVENPLLSFDELNKTIEEKIKRKLVVIGACIGSDAHTVGIDAMFNMKGYAHDWGFERYAWLSATNLRAQVSVEDLAKKVVELQADVVLVSRVVTQRDEHIVELKKFLEELGRTEGVNPKLIKICGGPRISHAEALSWGYDAGFGPGTKPSEVASFFVHRFLSGHPAI